MYRIIKRNSWVGANYQYQEQNLGDTETERNWENDALESHKKIKSASKNEFIITKLKWIYKDTKISDEKGCGAWLTALPLVSMGYNVFNKQ